MKEVHAKSQRRQERKEELLCLLRELCDFASLREMPLFRQFLHIPLGRGSDTLF